MNILFLIGNGFDINVGLNTRYKDALKFYLNEKNEDPRIKRFKDDIKENFENWADFENYLGVYTEKYSKDEIDDFCFCIKDFKESFIKHLKNEEKRINYDFHKDKIIEVFKNSIINFNKYINDSSLKLEMNNHLQKLQPDVNYDFITFNYTSVLDNCIKFKIILHIHGDVSKYPLFGVDNVKQIKNKEFANDDRIKNLIIKPKINEKLNNLKNDNAQNLINNSNIICLFGLSLGETDKTWWEKIGIQLQQPNVKLIIFDIADNLNPIHPDAEFNCIENMKNKFYEAANINDRLKSILNTKIFPVFNTNLFKINLVSNETSKSKI